MTRVRWLSPSPLWDDLLGDRTAFAAPALLRFAGDDFMEQYQAVLAQHPRNLRDHVARPETWRRPGAGLGRPAEGELRLYQPVHGRFYLVAGTLACRVPGLPEHTVDAAAGEVVSFVVRRLAAAGAEQAWVRRADGREGWVAAGGASLAPDEEQHPMFPTGFTGEDDCARRVFAGLVPASRREAYVGGRELPPASAAETPPAAGSLDDPRVLDFQARVLDPLVALKGWYDEEKDEGSVRHGRALDAAEQATAPMLLDLHDFLREEIRPVWDTMTGARSRASLPAAQRELYDRLNELGVYTRSAGQRASVLAAARNAADNREEIEAFLPGSALGSYVQRLLVGDPRVVIPSPAPSPDPAADEARLVALLARLSTPEEAPGLGVRRLKKLVMDALAEVGAAPVVRAEQLPSRAAANAQGDDRFVVRCVYERPRCGRKAPPVVSERSEPFHLSSFFEPDAPARRLRVALPVDTSPAALRKYNRNVAFMLSDQLRQQMSRVKDMEKLMEGDVDDPGPLGISMICSLSIPIITICALILLMILVSLLNIIFWWIPFFQICFPLPSLKAKG